MSHIVRPSFREVVHGYLILPHAVPIIVVMSATAAFALFAARGWPGAGPMSWLLLAMFGGQLAVGAINEIVDADLDAQSRPSKPIPAGLVSLRGAWSVAVIGLAVMTVASLTFSIPVFLVCAFGTGVGIAYRVWFKRTIWSWVPYLIALPLLPIWVWLALSTVDPGLYAIYPIWSPKGDSKPKRSPNPASLLMALHDVTVLVSGGYSPQEVGSWVRWGGAAGSG